MLNNVSTLELSDERSTTTPVTSFLSWVITHRKDFEEEAIANSRIKLVKNDIIIEDEGGFSGTIRI